MTEDYLTHAETIKAINLLKEKGIMVLGIDRFIKDGDYVIPDIGGIADFSDATIQQSHEASFKFSSEYGNDPQERFEIFEEAQKGK